MKHLKELLQRAFDALRAGDIHTTLNTLEECLRVFPREKGEEEKVNEAWWDIESDYYADVRSVADDIEKAWYAGEFDGDAEAVQTRIDESVDGTQRVTYTHQAAICMAVSRHDDIGIDELGVDSFDWKNGFPWSALAYWAFRADVMENLGSRDIDLDNPPHEGDIQCVECEQWMPKAHETGTKCGECCDCSICTEGKKEETSDAETDT